MHLSSTDQTTFLYSKVYQNKINTNPYYLKKKFFIKHKYRIWKKYQQLVSVKIALQSICPSRNSLNIKHWEFLSITAKERLKWLEENYTDYDALSQSQKYNFLQSLYGVLLLESHKQNNKKSKIELWSWYNHIRQYIDKRRYAWWYDNLRKHTKITNLNQRNPISFQNLTQLFWVKDMRNPWLSPLIFKRGLITTYATSKRLENKDTKETLHELKNYTRKKNPLYTKKLSLYKKYENLILRPWTKGWNKKKNEEELIIWLLKLFPLFTEI